MNHFPSLPLCLKVLNTETAIQVNTISADSDPRQVSGG